MLAWLDACFTDTVMILHDFIATACMMFGAESTAQHAGCAPLAATCNLQLAAACIDSSWRDNYAILE